MKLEYRPSQWSNTKSINYPKGSEVSAVREMLCENDLVESHYNNTNFLANPIRRALLVE